MALNVLFFQYIQQAAAVMATYALPFKYSVRTSIALLQARAGRASASAYGQLSFSCYHHAWRPEPYLIYA